MASAGSGPERRRRPEGARLLAQVRSVQAGAAVIALAILAPPAAAQNKVNFACGSYTTEMWRTNSTSHWTIARGAERNTESAVLKKGPTFSCVGGNTLAIEFTAASGQLFLDLHFPDGSNIGYGGQHLVRNGRYVLPIQARPRIPAEARSAFDYHCKLVMPADPISDDMRKDCVL